jgi:hypothetical protein
MRRTKEECLESLRKAKEILGETPSKGQYEELGLTPAHATILRKFDSWNAAKQEAGLDTLETGDRNDTSIKPKPDSLELDSDEEWEELTSQQRFYRKNKDRFRRNERQLIRKRKKWFQEYKRKYCSCERCEEEHPASLDFHYTEEKQWNISVMVHRGHSVENIKEEMEKCVVLCANCHRKEHFEPPKSADGKDVEDTP